MSYTGKGQAKLVGVKETTQKSLKTRAKLAFLSLKKTFKDIDNGNGDDCDNCCNVFGFVVTCLPFIVIAFIACVGALTIIFCTLLSLCLQFVSLFYDFGCPFKIIIPGYSYSKEEDDYCMTVSIWSFLGLMLLTLYITALSCIFRTTRKTYIEMVKKVDV